MTTAEALAAVNCAASGNAGAPARAHGHHRDPDDDFGGTLSTIAAPATAVVATPPVADAPASQATPVTRATPATSGGPDGHGTPAVPATPAAPAVPASERAGSSASVEGTDPGADPGGSTNAADPASRGDIDTPGGHDSSTTASEGEVAGQRIAGAVSSAHDDAVREGGQTGPRAPVDDGAPVDADGRSAPVAPGPQAGVGASAAVAGHDSAADTPVPSPTTPVPGSRPVQGAGDLDARTSPASVHGAGTAPMSTTSPAPTTTLPAASDTGGSGASAESSTASTPPGHGARDLDGGRASGASNSAAGRIAVDGGARPSPGDFGAMPDWTGSQSPSPSGGDTGNQPGTVPGSVLAPAAGLTSSLALTSAAGPAPQPGVSSGPGPLPDATAPAQQLVSVLAPLRMLGGSHQVTLALNPEGLGTVRATVTMGDQHLVVQLVVDNPNGHEALRQSLPQLRTLLDTGSGTTSVTLADAGGLGAGQDHGGQQPTASVAPGSADPEDDAAAAPILSAIPATILSRRLVDVRL